MIVVQKKNCRLMVTKWMTSLSIHQFALTWCVFVNKLIFEIFWLMFDLWQIRFALTEQQSTAQYINAAGDDTVGDDGTSEPFNYWLAPVSANRVASLTNSIKWQNIVCLRAIFIGWVLNLLSHLKKSNDKFRTKKQNRL